MFVDPYATLVRAPKPQYVLDLVRTAAPAALPLTVEEVKAHLRVEFDDDDDLIEGLIVAAADHLDGYAGVLGRCVLQQTWAWSLDHHFPGHRIAVPLPPLLEVVSIIYVDGDGATQTLDPAAYVALDGPRAAIEPAPGTCWPVTRCQSRAVTVTFKAGLAADPAGVPTPIKAALKLMVGDLYANREAVVIDASRVSMIENPTAARLIAPYVARR